MIDSIEFLYFTYPHWFRFLNRTRVRCPTRPGRSILPSVGPSEVLGVCPLLLVTMLLFLREPLEVLTFGMAEGYDKMEGYHTDPW